MTQTLTKLQAKRQLEARIDKKVRARREAFRLKILNNIPRKIIEGWLLGYDHLAVKWNRDELNRFFLDHWDVYHDKLKEYEKARILEAATSLTKE